MTATPNRAQNLSHAKASEDMEYDEHGTVIGAAASSQGESLTPKNVMKTKQLELRKDELQAATITKDIDNVIKRQITAGNGYRRDGYTISRTDVISNDTMGTKHRASITQFSNDMNLKQNIGQFAGLQGLGTLIEAKTPGAPGIVPFRQSQSSHKATVHQTHTLGSQPNDQVISIFDKDTDKNYLLQREVMMPSGLAGVTDQNKGSAVSIFKVQEVGTSKFKCLPVTDYGKIMNL